MNFQDLHELLRLELVRRIEEGSLTGTRLAQQTGFQQAHISNFLNRKRALSLEGLDRVLAAQDLSIDSLLPVNIAAGEASIFADPVESVPVVSSVSAIGEAKIEALSVIEMLQVSMSRLADNRERAAQKRSGWQRFVATRSDVQQAAAMEPILSPGSIAVIDRHYNSLAPYRAHQRTLYAVRYGSALLFRYVDLDDGLLILRPSALDYPVQLIAIGIQEAASDYIVGRVCMLVHEL